MRKIEHIGIAVKNLEISNLIFEKLFGTPSYKQEEVASEGVKTSFFMNGPNKIELLQATNPESPIAKFLEKKRRRNTPHRFRCPRYPFRNSSFTVRRLYYSKRNP